MKKRMLSLFLVLTLCLSLLPAAALAAEGDTGAEEPAAIQLGTGGLQSPTAEAVEGGTDYVPNSYVYFGAYNGKPVKWRVLDAAWTSDENEGVFLLSEQLLDRNVQFSPDVENNAWDGSNAQQWCTDFAGAAFSEAESAAVLPTTKTEKSGFDQTFGPFLLEHTLTGERVFFLSMPEAGSYLGSYDRAPQLIAKDADGNAATWWLRSPYHGDEPGISQAGIVNADGVVTAETVTAKLAARPAFNLDASSVLFVSPAQHNSGSGLEAVSAYSGSEWKLTLKDSAHAAFTAKTIGASEYGLTFSYQNAQFGENEYLSAIVTDENGNITYYGRVLDKPIEEPDSNQFVMLPDGFDKETDKIYLFNEQDNGAYKTNYASDLVELSLTPEPEKVTIQSITAVGEGRGNWLNGVSWDPADSSNHMTETPSGSGIFEITYTGIAAGDYWVKFVANDSWTHTWGVGYGVEDIPLSGNAAYNGDNVTFTVAQDNSTVKLALDLSEFDFGTKQGAAYSITITQPSSSEPSPVFVGGEQLLLNKNYVNDTETDGVKVSDDGSYNALVTEDEDGYTLTINGLNVTGKTNSENFSYKSSAIYTETSELKIVVNGDSTVTGATTSKHSAGVYAKGALTITGSGKLAAVGGNATGTGSGSYGVYCNAALRIDQATIQAQGGAAKDSSVGVFGYSITISGDDTVVTATGGAGSLRSCGMSSGGTIRLNGGKVIASGVKNAIGTSFDTNSANGKEVKYLVGGETLTDYNDVRVTGATSLTVMLGDPAPVLYTVRFNTNGGRLTGDGITAVEPNRQYTMQYQKGVGIPELPRPTLDGYTFGGWYDNQNFTGDAVGGITGSSMNFTLYAKWLKNVAFVETAGDPPRTSYYTSLNAAILAANEGDTVSLLVDTVTADITSGSFILNLNGKTLNTLTVSGSADIKLADSGWGSGTIGMISVKNGQIRDLCQDGYGLKTGGAWVTDEQLSGSSLRGDIKVYALPITSVTASTNKNMLNCGYTESATLTAGAEMASVPNYSEETLSYQWYSVSGEGENRTETAIQGETDKNYLFPVGKSVGVYTYFCEASCDGYTVRSNDVTVAVEKAGISGATIHLGMQGTYDGTEQDVVITSVTLGRKTLIKGTDYEIVSGGKATNVENTTLTIQGLGDYTGTASVSWSLRKATPSLSDFDQSVTDALKNGVEYTGKPIRIETPLKEGKSGMGKVDTYYKASDSTMAYRAAKDVGEYSVFFEIQEGQNYGGRTLDVGTLTVKKANYSGETLKNVSVRYDKANTDVAVTLPTLPDGASYVYTEFSFAKLADGTDCGYTFFPSGQRGVEGNTLYVTTESVTTPGIYADITIPVTGAKNYLDYVITVRVTCVDRTVVSFSGIEDNQTFVYDGTEKTPAGTLKVSVEEDAVDVGTLDVQYARVENGTVTQISGAPVNVGSYRVTYSVPDSNDQYKGSVTYSFTIQKADAPMLTGLPHSQKYTVTTQQTINLAHDLVDYMGMPNDAGTLSYKKGEARHQGGSSTVVWNVNADGTVSYTITNGTVGECVTLSVTVSSTNYADTSADIRITLTDLDTPAVTANPITVTYTGSAVSADAITGTAVFKGTPVPGAWSWAENQSCTNVSDSGEKTVVFTPEDSANYKPVEAKLRLTINPAALTDVSVRQTGTLRYTGSSQQASVETSAAAVNDQPVTFTYCDSANGTFRADVPSFTDAGAHTVYYKVAAPNHETATGSFTVTIARQLVAIPTADTTQFTYNGAEQTYTLAASDKYTVSGNVGKNAGSYTVTVTLKDAKNCVWSDETDGAKTYAFVIAKATATITVKDKSAYVNGTLPDLSKPALGQDYTVSGLFGGDTLTTAPTLRYDPFAPDLSKIGEAATIKASGASAGDNYEIAYDVDGKLTVSARPSSGGGHTSYPITIKDSKNGSASSSHKRAGAGTTVTITVAPNKGYTLETITVLGQNGKACKVTDKGNGKFTFTMPASGVTVTATFMDDNAMLNFFVDVKTRDYYYDAVLWAAKKGITSGTDALHFSPDQPCTRAQIVTFLWRTAGSPVVNYAMNMTDVPADAYYAEAVRWALSEGITVGTSQTAFSPDAPCTRAQAVTFLCRSEKASAEGGMAVREFTDFDSIPAYAVDAIQWALENHVTTGTGDGRFAPNAVCTRAQIVTFLYRLHLNRQDAGR